MYDWPRTFASWRAERLKAAASPADRLAAAAPASAPTLAAAAPASAPTLAAAPASAAAAAAPAATGCRMSRTPRPSRGSRGKSYCCRTSARNATMKTLARCCGSRPTASITA